MENTTHSFLDFQNLQNGEQKLIESLNLDRPKEPSKSPSESSLNSVLAYSKALSIRKSEYLGFIEEILN